MLMLVDSCLWTAAQVRTLLTLMGLANKIEQKVLPEQGLTCPGSVTLILTKDERGLSNQTCFDCGHLFC